MSKKFVKEKRTENRVIFLSGYPKEKLGKANLKADKRFSGSNSRARSFPGFLIPSKIRWDRIDE
jgi:hypothetical protein